MCSWKHYVSRRPLEINNPLIGGEQLKFLDSVDKEILKLLKEDGRLSYRAMADKLGMEGSTVRKRVRKLLEREAIKRFTIVVNSKASSEDVTAFITVFPFLRYSEEIKKQLIDFEEVVESHYLAGRCGVFLKANFRNVQALNDFVKKVRDMPGVARVRSCIVTKKLT